MLSKAKWKDLPALTQRVLLRVSELGVMDRASIVTLCLKGERKSPAGRRDLRHSGSRLETASALNRVSRLVTAKLLVYERSFVLGDRRYYPLRLNEAHDACKVLASGNATRESGIAATVVAAALQKKRDFVIGRDRDTVLAYTGGRVAFGYRCVVCGASAADVADLRCPETDNGGRCRFAAFADDHRLARDVGLRLRSDGSLSCAVVWTDDGRAIDEQWGEVAPLVRLAQEPRVRVVVRAGDGSVFNTETQRFTVVHPRLARMLRLIEGVGAKATAGVNAAHRLSEQRRPQPAC